jgi:hypothetical protein
VLEETFMTGNALRNEKRCMVSGFMNPQPIAMNTRTMPTFIATMMVLTVADSEVPLISKSVRIKTMKSAGTFMMPCTPVVEVSNGEWHHSKGIRPPHNLLRYSLHAIDTVPAPNAYSSTSAHPITHATNSPMVT